MTDENLNIQIVLGQESSIDSNGTPIVKNETLAFGLPFLPTNFSFTGALLIDNVGFNQADHSIKVWINDIDGNKIVSSEIGFDTKADDGEKHLGSNITNLSFVNILFEKVGIYTMSLQIDDQIYPSVHKFRTFRYEQAED